MSRNPNLKQKIVVSPDVLEIKRKGFLGFVKSKTEEDVFRVDKSLNFRAREYYYPKEIDELMEMGVEVEIKTEN